MDKDLMSAFLATLKDVNSTLLELTKITASNQLSIRLMGITFVLIAGGFITWAFSHIDLDIFIKSGG